MARVRVVLFFITFLLEDINKIHGCFSGKEAVAVSLPGFLPASLTFEDVVVRINPSDTELGLHVPVFSENPGISVSQTGSGIPTLVAVVAEFGEVHSEEVACESEVAHVKLAAEAVEGEEVSGGGIAEPVAHLRLHEPVFPPPAMRERPCVEVARQVYRPPGGHFQFSTEVYCGSGIIKKIGLDSDLLRVGRESGCAQGNCGKGGGESLPMCSFG